MTFFSGIHNRVFFEIGDLEIVVYSGIHNRVFLKLVIYYKWKKIIYFFYSTVEKVDGGGFPI